MRYSCIRICILFLKIIVIPAQAPMQICRSLQVPCVHMHIFIVYKNYHAILVYSVLIVGCNSQSGSAEMKYRNYRLLCLFIHVKGKSKLYVLHCLCTVDEASIGAHHPPRCLKKHLHIINSRTKPSLSLPLAAAFLVIELFFHCITEVF